MQRRANERDPLVVNVAGGDILSHAAGEDILFLDKFYGKIIHALNKKHLHDTLTALLKIRADFDKAITKAAAAIDPNSVLTNPADLSISSNWKSFSGVTVKCRVDEKNEPSLVINILPFEKKRNRCIMNGVQLHPAVFLELIIDVLLEGVSLEDGSERSVGFWCCCQGSDYRARFQETETAASRYVAGVTTPAATPSERGAPANVAVDAAEVTKHKAYLSTILEQLSGYLMSYEGRELLEALNELRTNLLEVVSAFIGQSLSRNDYYRDPRYQRDVPEIQQLRPKVGVITAMLLPNDCGTRMNPLEFLDHFIAGYEARMRLSPTALGLSAPIEIRRENGSSSTLEGAEKSTPESEVSTYAMER